MKKYFIKKSLMRTIIYGLVFGTVNYGVASASNPPIVYEDQKTHEYSDNINIVATSLLFGGYNVAIGAGMENTVINFKKDVGVNLSSAAFVGSAIENFGIYSIGSTINVDGNLVVDINADDKTVYGIAAATLGGINVKENARITMYAGQGGSLVAVAGYAPTIQGNTYINLYAADGAYSAYGYKDLRDRRINTPLNISGGIQNINIVAENGKELGGIVRWNNSDINLINNTVVGIGIKSTNSNVDWYNMRIQGVSGVLNLESGSKLNINMDLGTKSTLEPTQLLAQSTMYNYVLTTAGLYITPVIMGINTKGNLQAGSTTYIQVSGAPLWDTEDFYGRKFGSGSVVGLAALSSVQVDGKLTVDVVSEKGVGIMVHDGIDAAGRIALNGETIINTNKGYALLSESVNWADQNNRYYNVNYYTTESRIDINKNGGSLVQIVGDIDHRTLRESQYTINLDRADSFLIGSSMQSNAKEINYLGTIIKPKGITDITLANGAHWYMTGLSDNNDTGNSVVNELRFSKGYLDMTPSGSNGYETLTAAKLLGSDGNILFSTDLQQSFDTKDVLTNSDKIIITTASAGVHTIDIKDASLLNKLPSAGYLLLVEDRSRWTVSIAGLGAVQSLDQAVFVGGKLKKGGIFKYKPIITSVAPAPESGYSNIPTNATNWYLTGFEKQGVNDDVFANAGLVESRYVSYLNEQDTLVKRLGELRQTDKEKGIWVRIRGSNNSVDGLGVNRNSYVSTYLGYDWRLQDANNAKRYAGLALNHTNNNFDYALGSSGKGQSNVLTVYGTRLGDKGHYLDLVGKIGRMSNDYKYQDNTVAAKNWFYSLSAEYGRSIAQEKGWYYEPQAQFTLGRINGTSYNANGIHVDADGITSAILRGGILAGRKFNQDKQEKMGSYYAKVFYNYEFGGNVQAQMTDVYGDYLNFSHNYKGGWLTVGLGTSLNLNKKTNLYLDVEKAFGGKISGGWAWQGGVRWRF